MFPVPHTVSVFCLSVKAALILETSRSHHHSPAVRVPFRMLAHSKAVAICTEKSQQGSVPMCRFLSFFVCTYITYIQIHTPSVSSVAFHGAGGLNWSW